MLETLRTTDVHPPLHHLVLWLTVHVLGTGELAVRLPSLLAATALVPALYAAGRDLYDRRAGLAAAALGDGRAVRRLVRAGGAHVRAVHAVRAARRLDAGARAARRPRRDWIGLHARRAALVATQYFGAAARRRPAARVRSPRCGRAARDRAGCAGWSPGWRPAPLLALAARAAAGFAHDQFAANEAAGKGFQQVPSQTGGARRRRPARRPVPTPRSRTPSGRVLGYHSDATMTRLVALWPLLMLLALALLGRGRSRRTALLVAAAVAARASRCSGSASSSRSCSRCATSSAPCRSCCCSWARARRAGRRGAGTAARGRGVATGAARGRARRPAAQRQQPARVRLPRRARATSPSVRVPGDVRRLLAALPRPRRRLLRGGRRGAPARTRGLPQPRAGQRRVRARLVPRQAAIPRRRPPRRSGRSTAGTSSSPSAATRRSASGSSDDTIAEPSTPACARRCWSAASADAGARAATRLRAAARGPARAVLLRLAARARARRPAAALRAARRAELFNLVAGDRLLVDVRGRALAAAGCARAGPPPRVDVLVPVYDEPVAIVEPTVAAAARMTGAEVRVWLLDDGALGRDARARRRATARDYVRRARPSRRQGGQHQPRAALHRRRRTWSCSTATTCPRRTSSRRRSATSPTSASRSCRRRSTTPTPAGATIAGGGVEPAGAVLRPDRARQGRPRRDVLLRHERRLPPRRAESTSAASRQDSVTEDFELSIRLHERGWRSRYVPEVLAPRARARGHGVLRQPAAALVARLPGRARRRAARAAAAAQLKLQYALSASYFLSGLDGARLHVVPGRAHPHGRAAARRRRRPTSSSPTSPRTSAGAAGADVARRRRLHVQRVRAAGGELLDPRAGDAARAPAAAAAASSSRRRRARRAPAARGRAGAGRPRRARRRGRVRAGARPRSRPRSTTSRSPRCTSRAARGRAARAARRAARALGRRGARAGRADASSEPVPA